MNPSITDLGIPAESELRGIGIRALQTDQPLRVLPDEIAEKTAREIEGYPQQDDRHFEQLKAILDDEGSNYKI